MPCGCTNSTGTDMASKALTCHLCLWAEHGPSAMNDGAISCTVDGLPVVGRNTCPKGKFAVHNGETICKSLGIWHYGAAWWQRLIVMCLKTSRPKYKTFGGCGCVVVLKDLTTILSVKGR